MAKYYLTLSFPEFRIWIMNFITNILAHQTAWGLPVTETAALNTDITQYTVLDDAANASDAGPIALTARAAGRETLKGKISKYVNKFINNNDKIDAAARRLLCLPSHDSVRTKKEAPKSTATAIVKHPADHAVELHIEVASEEGDHEGCGVRIHYGKFDRSGKLPHEKGDMSAPPQTEDDLPLSHFTRRRIYRFNFSRVDSGKVLYICLRYENSKGDEGPWGPMIEVIIT
jgi:hypothetical protein